MKLPFFCIQDGSLKTKTLSCLACLEKGSECEKCAETPAFKSPEQIQAALALPGSEVEDEEENGLELDDEEDADEIVESDSGEDSDSEEETDDEETDDEVE